MRPERRPRFHFIRVSLCASVAKIAAEGVGCAGCHGPAGSGIPSQYPRLAGQHTEYTLAQLRAFRDRSRPNSPQMTGIAALMTDREIAAVADYIAGLR